MYANFTICVLLRSTAAPGVLGLGGEGKSNLSLIGKGVRGLLGAYRAFLNDKNGLLCIHSPLLGRTNHPVQLITCFRKRYGIFVSSHIPPPPLPLRLPLPPSMKKRTSPKTSTKPVSQSLFCLWESSASEVCSIGAGVGGGEGKPLLLEDIPSLLCSTLADVAEFWRRELGRLRKG